MASLQARGLDVYNDNNEKIGASANLLVDSSGKDTGRDRRCRRGSWASVNAMWRSHSSRLRLVNERALSQPQPRSPPNASRYLRGATVTPLGAASRPRRRPRHGGHGSTCRCGCYAPTPDHAGANDKHDQGSVEGGSEFKYTRLGSWIVTKGAICPFGFFCSPDFKVNAKAIDQVRDVAVAMDEATSSYRAALLNTFAISLSLTGSYSGGRESPDTFRDKDGAFLDRL